MLVFSFFLKRRKSTASCHAVRKMCPKRAVCGEIRLFVAKFGHFCGEKLHFANMFVCFYLILGAKNKPIFEQKTGFGMKKSSFTTPLRIFLIVATLLSTMVFTQAQTFLGTTGDNLWSNADNWLDGLKPTGMFSEVTVSADVIVDEDVSIGTLTNAGNYTLTVRSEHMLIVNVAIDWVNNDFILEDKAELVYSEPLKVTIKKHITAYDENNHLWCLIASPIREDVIPSTENGFLTEPETGYGLYSYDESAVEWINYKESPFAIEFGKSYLYANALDTTLTFEGSTIGYQAECQLSYHAENGAYAGYNFVGNPLPCNAYLGRSYYVLSHESKTLIAVAKSSPQYLVPCSGLIVNAEGPDDTEALFSYMPFFQNLGHQGYIEITVAKSDAPSSVLDQALLSFNEGDDLVKFSLFEDAPRVYFTQGDKDLAILSVDSVDAQPMRFMVEQNGSYTMHVEPKDRDVEYLHLIDNNTGSDVDLLANPDYTFTATTNDYASRFKLVFNPHYGMEDYENVPFAYISNGRLYINEVETCQGASLQIVDMTGRVVISVGDVSGNVSTTGMAPGVYVLHLIDCNTIRTQKIVIE